MEIKQVNNLPPLFGLPWRIEGHTETHPPFHFNLDICTYVFSPSIKNNKNNNCFMHLIKIIFFNYTRKRAFYSEKRKLPI